MEPSPHASALPTDEEIVRRVSAALGISEDVVRTRLLRARGALRRELSRAGVESTDAYRLHLDRCDRVVLGVLPRLLPPGSSPPAG